MKKNNQRQNAKRTNNKLKRKNKKRVKTIVNKSVQIEETLGQLYREAMLSHNKNIHAIENSFDELQPYKDKVKQETWEQLVELKDDILSFDKTCDKTLDLDAVINDEVVLELHLTKYDVIEDASETVLTIAQHTLDRANVFRDILIQISNAGYEENVGDVVEHHTDVRVQ